MTRRTIAALAAPLALTPAFALAQDEGRATPALTHADVSLDLTPPAPADPVITDFSDVQLLLNSSARANRLPIPGPRGPVDWVVAGSDIYFNSGNVGIGTATPIYPLNILAAAANNILSVNTLPGGNAVTGFATGAGASKGLFGISTSNAGIGLFGQANAANGVTYGVDGQASSVNGRGVRGLATATTGVNFGVYAESRSANGRGILGYASSNTGVNFGAFGLSASPNGFGIFAQNTATTGNAFGLYAQTSSTFGLAAKFAGGAGVSIDKGSTSSSGTALEIDGGQIIFNEETGSPGFVNMGYVNGSPDYFFITSDPDIRIVKFGFAKIEVGSAGVAVNRVATTNAFEVEGEASKTFAGAWLANSDARIKTNVQTVTDALDTIDRVRLVSFGYTDDYKAAHPTLADHRYLNVIAQEFAQVFPDHVKGSGEFLPDGSEILQVDTYPLTIYAAAAVQELRDLSDSQAARITQLESDSTAQAERLAALESRLDAANTQPSRASLAVPALLAMTIPAAILVPAIRRRR